MHSKFEDTKGAIRSREWKDRPRDKRTSNDLQNISQKTKDRETGTPLKSEGEPMYSGIVGGSPCSACGTCRIILVTKPVTSHE